MVVFIYHLVIDELIRVYLEDQVDNWRQFGAGVGTDVAREGNPPRVTILRDTPFAIRETPKAKKSSARRPAAPLCP